MVPWEDGKDDGFYKVTSISNRILKRLRNNDLNSECKFFVLSYLVYNMTYYSTTIALGSFSYLFF